MVVSLLAASMPSFAQNLQLGFGGNFFFNPSTINKIYGPGINTEAAAYIPLNDQIEVGIALHYSRNGLDGGEALRQIGFDNLGINVDGGTHSTVLGTLRLRLKGDVPWAPGASSLAVVGGGLAYRRIADIDVSALWIIEDDVLRITETVESESETNRAIIVGFGFRYRLSSVVGLYFLPEYHHIIIDGSDIQSIVPKVGLIIGRL